jgi:hypothetical protein
VTLAGLPLSTLAAAFAAIGAAVVLLYVLKLKRRPIAVPFSRIWERILRDKEATSLFAQLKRLLSLLLQLAIVAAMILALGDPRTAANLIEGRNVVVLVDASASMQAIDVAPSRLEAGKKRLLEAVRGLGGSDRMLIAQMDAATTPLSTLTGDVAELEAAVEKVEPTEARADLARGLRFASDVLRGLPKAEIVVVSDGVLGEAKDQFGAVDLGGAKLSFVGVGERGTNAAITAFSVRRYPLDKSRYEVMLEVTNASAEPLEVELTLWGDGQITDVTRLRLGPNERLPRFYPNLSGASRTLEARLALADGGRDDLPADDHAYALLPERRRARVQVVTPGNMYLEAALLLDEYLDVTTVAPDRYPAAGTFDVTIFDAVAPKVAPGSGSLLYLGPGSAADAGALPFELEKPVLDDDPEIALGFDDVDEKHPLLRWANLVDINVARATPIRPGKEDRVVGKSFRGPLLVEGRRDGRRFVALGFDVRESDFPLRIAWPLFLLSTIDLFVEEDTSYISSFATGEVWRIPAPSGATAATLTTPGGAALPVPVQQDRAVFLGRRAGFYELAAGPDGARTTSGFAANLVDAAESDVEPVKELKVGDVVAGEVSGFTVGVRREVWGYLLAAVVAVSAIEWLLYHRRVTV